jgi:bifunctional non-homologous end joining protein LigD
VKSTILYVRPPAPISQVNSIPRKCCTRTGLEGHPEGFDWSDRYPRIVQSARKVRSTKFLIDGEAVIVGEDGVSDFNKPHSRQHDSSVFLYAFDLLSVDGTDIRHERLDDRRAKLKPLLARPDGVRFSDHHAGDGQLMFRHACQMGLEGIVSKRRDAPYRSGRNKVWLKVKNPDSPAMRRLVEDGF